MTLDDVKVAMRKRNLPVQYAKDFMNRVRRNRWWLSSIGFAASALSPHSSSRNSTADPKGKHQVERLQVPG